MRPKSVSAGSKFAHHLDEGQGFGMMSAPNPDPTPRAISGGRPPVLHKALVVLALLLIAVLVTLAQRSMSPTYDEPNHVTRGIAILRTGDYRLSLDHPPLANLLEALPVAWRFHGFSTGIPEWRFPVDLGGVAQRTIWRDPVQGVGLIRTARLPVLVFTLGLGLLIYLWARALFGPWGGVLSLAFYALEPTMLAHGGLATTDMAAACGMTLALFLLRGCLIDPTPRRRLMAGAGLGIALTSKYSLLFLLPIIGLILLLVALCPPRAGSAYPRDWPGSPGPRALRALTMYLSLLLIAGIVVWGVYGFNLEPLGGWNGESSPPGVSAAIDRIPLPAPQFLRGIRAVLAGAQYHPAYLLGSTDTSGKGWWYYYLVVIAVKTPVPELLAVAGMLLLAFIPVLRARLGFRDHEWLLLLLPVGLYFVVATGVFGMSLYLGIRHLMPMYPLLLVLVGGWAVVLSRRRRLLLAVLLSAQCTSVLGAFPDFIGYFNEPSRYIGGDGAILIDSNLDWGQDLGRLAEFQRQHNIGTIHFSYFGTAPPEAYGLDYIPLRGFGLMRKAPLPDWPSLNRGAYVAVSATNLYGGPGYTWGADYRSLQRRQDGIRVGRTIFVYRLGPPGPGGT